MTIPVVFLTAVLKKSAVRYHYAGGEAAFRVRYPYAAEDRYLFGLASMSGQEMDELLTELAVANIELTRDGALADRTGGASCPTRTSSSASATQRNSRGWRRGSCAMIRSRWRARARESCAS